MQSIMRDKRRKNVVGQSSRIRIRICEYSPIHFGVGDMYLSIYHTLGVTQTLIP